MFTNPEPSGYKKCNRRKEKRLMRLAPGGVVLSEINSNDYGKTLDDYLRFRSI
jgi:hypothetical protein